MGKTPTPTPLPCPRLNHVPVLGDACGPCTFSSRFIGHLPSVPDLSLGLRPRQDPAVSLS